MNHDEPIFREIYYTPQIEDFHIGFEYEIKRYSDSKWIREIFSLEHGWCYIGVNQIRVKYLDKEDIESLGWKYEKTHSGLNEDYFEFGEHYMDCNYDENYIRIAMFGNGDVTRFSGTIKNKSELKKLMKQIDLTTTVAPNEV